MDGITNPRYQRYIGINLALVFLTCGIWLPIWGFIEIIKTIVNRGNNGVPSSYYSSGQEFYQDAQGRTFRRGPAKPPYPPQF